MGIALRSLPRAVSAGLVATFVRASSVFAQSFAGPSPAIPGTPNENPDIRGIISSLLITVLNFLALIAVIVVVVAGIRLIISQGDEEARDKAKKTILYALIGLAVVLFARVIVGLVTEWLAGQV